MNFKNDHYYSKKYRHKPLRHPENKELSLTYEQVYRNTPIQTDYGPMVTSYMDALIETITRQLDQYSKVFALRVDLYFPNSWSEQQRFNLDYYTRFMDSLRAKLAAFDYRKAKVGDSRSNTVRFCRVYETGVFRGVHIHAVLFFNGHVFRSLGDFSSSDENLYHRINGAWASALQIFPTEVVSQGLVHFNQPFYIEKGRAETSEQLRQLFTQSAYLCKADTKRYDLPVKVFSRSRG